MGWAGVVAVAEKWWPGDGPFVLVWETGICRGCAGGGLSLLS